MLKRKIIQKSDSAGASQKIQTSLTYTIKSFDLFIYLTGNITTFQRDLYKEKIKRSIILKHKYIKCSWTTVRQSWTEYRLVLKTNDGSVTIQPQKGYFGTPTNSGPDVKALFKDGYIRTVKILSIHLLIPIGVL